jgi:hypothetical protein
MTSERLPVPTTEPDALPDGWKPCRWIRISTEGNVIGLIDRGLVNHHQRAYTATAWTPSGQMWQHDYAVTTAAEAARYVDEIITHPHTAPVGDLSIEGVSR